MANHREMSEQCQESGVTLVIHSRINHAIPKQIEDTPGRRQANKLSEQKSHHESLITWMRYVMRFESASQRLCKFE